MTQSEFSNQFDVLYNNITSNQAPGLNEYEKSVFLTKAQDEMVKNYFNRKSNPKGEGFDDTRKRQMDFARLMKSVQLDFAGPELGTYTKFDPRSYCFMLPDDVFLIINEQLVYIDKIQLDAKIFPGYLAATRQIMPLSLDDYMRLMSKPYKEPLKYQAWRLITGQAETDASRVVEVITRSVDRVLNITYTPSITFTPSTDTSDSNNTNDNTSDDTSGEGGKDIVNGDTNPGVTPVDNVGDVTEGNGTDTGDDSGTDTGTGDDSTTPTEGTTPSTPTPITVTIRPKYALRYVRRPRPIILSNFTGNLGETLSIHGKNGSEDVYTDGLHPCELDPIMHEEILQRAVELAKVAWTNNGQDNINMVIEAGKRSE